MMTATDETRRYAHEIAPRPTPNTPRERMAETMYAHHAARAQALWRAVLDGTIPGNPSGIWAVEPAHQEWLITVLLRELQIRKDATSAAVDILANQSSPHTMSEWTWELCREAGIDPDTVRPYVRDDVLPKESAAPAETPDPAPVNGSTSDGYHTFDELYQHRTDLARPAEQIRASQPQPEGDQP